MDSLFHLTYDGMQLWLLRSGYDGREFAVNVHLTDSRRRLPGGFQPGITSRHALYGRLGNPDAQHQMGDTIVWGYLPFPGDAEEYVQFYLVSDSLRKIRWALYVD